jgi:hypothetical protein
MRLILFIQYLKHEFTIVFLCVCADIKLFHAAAAAIWIAAAAVAATATPATATASATATAI